MFLATIPTYHTEDSKDQKETQDHEKEKAEINRLANLPTKLQRKNFFEKT
jgi:hypothetical protein